MIFDRIILEPKAEKVWLNKLIFCLHDFMRLVILKSRVYLQPWALLSSSIKRVQMILECGVWIYFVQCWDLVQALKNTNVFSNELVVYFTKEYSCSA